MTGCARRIAAARARLARLRQPPFGLSPEMKAFIDARTSRELTILAAYRHQLMDGGPVDPDLTGQIERMLTEHRGRIAP